MKIIFLLLWIVVCVAAAGGHVLPAQRSAEVLRDEAVAESDAGHRRRHLPDRQGTTTHDEQ